MKLTLLLFLYANTVLMLGTACLANPAAKSPDEAYSSTSDYLVALNSEDIVRKKILAMQGDVNAASEVANHYSVGLNIRNYINRKKYLEATFKQKEQEIYWLSIAAENDILASKYLAEALARKGGFLNCHRSVFWLRKFKKNAPKKWNVQKRAIVTDENLLQSLETKNHDCWKK
jgi:hypothetical protein